MDKIDQSLKAYLEKEWRRSISRRPRAGYPTIDDFYLYLTGGMKEGDRGRFLEYLKTRPEEEAVVLQARELLGGEPGADSEAVPASWLNEAKGLIKAAPRASETPLLRPFKKLIDRQVWWSRFWFFLAAAAFITSFFVPRYFIQFLVLTLLFGIKGIVDSKQAKTQILVYRSLQEDQKDDQASHLHRTSSHL